MTFDFVASQLGGAARILDWIGPWFYFVMGWLLFTAVIRALLTLRKPRAIGSGSSGGSQAPRKESKGG